MCAVWKELFHRIIDSARLDCDTRKEKTNAGPSTSLRFAQDDSSLVMKSFCAGSIVPEERKSR